MTRFTWCGVLLLWSLSALAQAPLPSVTPFPLEVKRAPKGFSEKHRKDLVREFRRVLSASAQVPDSASLESAMAQLKREDCGRENECLQQLARYGQTLYAIFAAVELSADDKRVVISGRVIRDDGLPMGEPASIELPKGKESFSELANQGLARLVERLIVEPRLPPFRSKAPEPVVVKTPPTAAPEKVVPVVVTPPKSEPPLVVAPAPTPTTKPLRVVGWALVGVGAATAIAGGVTFGVARGSITADGAGNIARGDTGKVSTERVGVGLLVGGAVAAATGAALVLVARDTDEVRLSFWGGPGGAGVVFSGELP
jgi:hypothetical protein